MRKSSVNKKKNPSISNNSIAASNRGNKISLKDLLAKARQEPSSSVIENESQASSFTRRRMLQIRGLREELPTKERFNENNDEQTESIRQ